jgi:hypothetical protein
MRRLSRADGVYLAMVLALAFITAVLYGAILAASV